MKRNFSYLLVVFCTIFFSCKDFLNDTNSGDLLPLDEVFETGSDMEAGLVGAYDLLQSGDALGGNILALADVMAYNAEGWFEEASTLQMEPNHWMTERLWTQSYRAINQANAILKAHPKVVAADASFQPEDARRIEGEALFIRAVLHFELVRLYAKPYTEEFASEMGVPVMTEPVLKKETISFPARATIGQVYEQVSSDLTRARDLLPMDNTRGRANYYAALSYLARIAFQKRDYQTAERLTGEILESGRYQLATTPQDFFINEGSPEEIWVIYASGEGDPIDGGLSSVYNDAPVTARITDDLKKTGFNSLLSIQQSMDIQNGGYVFVDLRCDPFNVFSKGNLLVVQADSSKCNKYEHDWLSGEDDAPLIRLAEIILMRAEALARLNGINEESVTLLNSVRRRSMRVIDQGSNLTPESDELISFQVADFQNNLTALLDAIIRERRVELAFEGNYLHDLMRLKREVRNGEKVLNFYDKILRLPIPQREIDANPNLQQNP